MKMLIPPLVASTIALLSLSLSAQERLPDSYLQKLATIDRLKKLTSTDFAVLTSGAQSGAAEAQYQLALVYGAGRIVPRDEVASRGWMMKAAEQGQVPAETFIGLMYLDNHTTGPVPNYADAEGWLRLAAAQGDAEAELWLGLGYAREYFGRIDYQESLKWLRKSSAQGLPDAQVCLGQMYEEGKGVRTSNERAGYWFRRAADHFSDISGVFSAIGELAHMYGDERLKGNDIDAYMWLAVADASLDPPIDPATDGDLERVARRMTKQEIVEAQRRTRDWINHHLALHELPASLNP
jgi:tetratricopeptide (TPR) repeat protein